MGRWIRRFFQSVMSGRALGKIERYRIQKKFGLSRIEPQEKISIIASEFGEKCFISEPVSIWNSRIGAYSRIRSYTQIECTDVGNFCSIARNAFVGMGPHPTKEYVSIHPFFYSPDDELGYAAEGHFGPPHPRTSIGHDVWIGSGAKVVAGVSIQSGAVIGAGSVVTRDVPAYAIYAGIPAKLVRYRFDEETIRFLMDFRWWNKDIEWLRKNYRLFHSVESIKRATDKYGEMRTDL